MSGVCKLAPNQSPGRHFQVTFGVYDHRTFAAELQVNVNRSLQWADSTLTSVVTGLNVLAAAVSTIEPTRALPVYRTFVKDQRTFDGKRKFVTDYDPTEAPKSTKMAISFFTPR